MSRILVASIGFLAVFVLLTAFQRTIADTIVDAPDRPWEACGDCHGVDGISATAHFPKLAGQKLAYIEKELRDFHSGARANDSGQMSGIGDFSDSALKLAARYFSRLPAPPPTGHSGNNASRARAIIEAGLPLGGVPACRFCHNAVADAVPWLEAQHAGYLAKELRDFKSGVRANDKVMSDIARHLSEADIDDLANYLAAIPRPSAGADRSAR